MKEKPVSQTQSEKVKRIRFYLNEELNPLDGVKIRDDISSVVRTGKNIWIGFDESLGLERLERTEKGYENHHAPLRDFIDLKDDSEVDIEGLAYDDYYLWVAGSQSKKRNDVDEEDSLEEQIQDLTEIKYDANRYTLARIPCIPDANGVWHLHKECQHPEKKDITLRAAKLKAGKKHSQLSKKLSKDPHIKTFMKVPCKENGFDIEGLAVKGDRVFLGMRGPVIRGWAIIIEVAFKETKKGKLKLKKITEDDQKYRKHFLNLYGMGIREICMQTNDLLILAGPTMDLDGTIGLFRVKNGLPDQDTNILDDVERVYDITDGTEIAHGKDKAEGIAPTEDGNLLIVYDAPREERRKGNADVEMDIFPYQSLNAD